LFGKTRTAYYKAIKSKKKHEQQYNHLLQLVLQTRKRLPMVGAKKLYFLIKPKMNELNIKMGRDKFIYFLKSNNLLIKIKRNKCITTHTHKWFNGYGNKIKNLIINKPEQVWVADITYIRIVDGFKYLSLITDAFSRKIMGYYLSDNLKTKSSIIALNKALKNKIYNRTLIHHSDRGIQYCSKNYISILGKHNIISSTTQNSDPYENAIAERINGILKQEFLFNAELMTMTQVKKTIEKAIYEYNQFRPHWALKFSTPNQVHLSQKITKFNN